MNIDLTKLQQGIDKEIVINEHYSFTKEQLVGTDIETLNNVSIEGSITKDAMGELYIELDINGIMIIPCAITLKPVEYPFSTYIEGNIEEFLSENTQKYQNTLDILPIIWENILVEIPMRVVSDDVTDAITSGDGWRLITGEEKEENVELSKLKDLL